MGFEREAKGTPSIFEEGEPPFWYPEKCGGGGGWFKGKLKGTPQPIVEVPRTSDCFFEYILFSLVEPNKHHTQMSMSRCFEGTRFEVGSNRCPPGTQPFCGLPILDI